MNKIEVFKNVVKTKTARPLLKLRKHSPEILLGVGVVGVVTATVLACRATLKAKDVITDAQDSLEVIDVIEKESHDDSYPVQDRLKVYANTAFELTKLYLPAALVGAGSIGLMVKSNNVLHKRNVAAVAAYQMVSESYKSYRKRVADDLGEEKERFYRHAVSKETITVEETDSETGKVKKVKKNVEVSRLDTASEYSKFFDDYSTLWKKNAEYNLAFLRLQEKQANDLLRIQGHMFLNEVYDMLDIPRTQAGAIVGWVLDNPDGDGHISFGIYDYKNSDFVNGHNDKILLDFNVDGVIWNLI